MVRSVARALDLLELLESGDPLTLSELAEGSGLHPPTAHRLLQTLVLRGYVKRDAATRGYALGPRADRLPLTRRLRTVSAPLLMRLCKVSDETANLVLLRGWQVVYVDQLAAGQAPSPLPTPRRRIAAHATAAGKAMLACAGPRVLAQLRSREPLAAYTDRTCTTRMRLAEEFELIGERGFATDIEEHERGTACVAAAVVDADGTIAGALSVSGAVGRLASASLHELGELVSTAASDASQALGYRGRPIPRGGNGSLADGSLEP